MIVDTKNVTLPLYTLSTSRNYMKPHPTTNRQCYFMHQILSESNKNCKVLQNSQKKSIHEVSGHFDTIWPNFTLPAIEQVFPVAVKLETLIHKTEHTVGLKISLEGSTSNSKQFWYRFAQKENSRNKVSSSGSDSNEDIRSSIRASGSTIKIRGSSPDTPKSPTGQPRKDTFCLTDQEIDKTDGIGPLVTINIWNYMIIWHQSAWKSIGNQGFLHRG